MMVPASSSYEEDDKPRLLDFIKNYDMIVNIVKLHHLTCFTDLLTCHRSSRKFYVLRQMFTNLLGYVIWLVEVATSQNCTVCTEAVRVQFPAGGQLSSSLFTRLKSYDLEGNLDNFNKTNFLCHPSPQVLRF